MGARTLANPLIAQQLATPVPGGMFLCMETDETTAMSTDTDRRQLVTIETVTDVRAIPGADAIEVVTVRGWQVVTKIGELGVVVAGGRDSHSFTYARRGDAQICCAGKIGTYDNFRTHQ